MYLARSHKCIREMEHELFQSELKPSVDGALLSDIIRSSSSGQNSYRTAAMELLFERSIQARREKAFVKVESSVRQDPTPQSTRACEALNNTIPQMQSPTPATALQPPSSPSTGIAASPAMAPTKHEISQDLLSLSNPPKEVKVARGEEPPADAKIDVSPSEDVVQLECPKCNVEQFRSHLRSDIYCPRCFRRRRKIFMKCVGCGTVRVCDPDACLNCHQKFK